MSNWAPHLIGLATPLSAIICLMIGGWWMIVPIVLLLGIYPFMDTIAGSTTVFDIEDEGKGHDFIVHLHGLLVPLIVAALLYSCLLYTSPSPRDS